MACPLRDRDRQRIGNIESTTVGGFFIELLTEVFARNVNFNGKRPFGNSGWIWAIMDALVAEGIVKEDDDDGFADAVSDALGTMGGLISSVDRLIESASDPANHSSILAENTEAAIQLLATFGGSQQSTT